MPIIDRKGTHGDPNNRLHWWMHHNLMGTAKRARRGKNEHRKNKKRSRVRARK